MRTGFFTFLVIGFVCLVALSGSVWATDLPTLEIQLPTQQEVELEKAIFSTDGSTMAIFCQEAGEMRRKDQLIFIYDFLHKKWTRAVDRPQGFLWEIEPLALNFDGSRLAYRDGEDLVIMDLNTHEKLQHVDGAGSMTQATFSRSGDQVAFLKIAEWELPTSLYLVNLVDGSQKKLVDYSGETKAAGPLHWDAQSGIYFVEEFTWGTINSKGILKVYQPHKDKVLTIYELPWSSSRVSNYYLSPNGEYLSMVIREFDDKLENSEYGLLIQKQGRFVYGTKLADWQDRTESSHISTDLSCGGWIGKQQFYWINRDQQVYNLYLYDIQKAEHTQYQYNQPVLVTPYGDIIKLGR